MIVWVMSVAIVTIITALVITVLCAPEQDKVELAEIVEHMNDPTGAERQIDWDNLPP